MEDTAMTGESASNNGQHHQPNNNKHITELLINSIACHNTNFNAPNNNKGDQLRLDLMFRWMRCRVNGQRPDLSALWFEKLCQSHSESSRHYHTLMHLEEMFLYLDLMQTNQVIKLTALEEETIVLATFFHDAIYNVHSGTNEEDSAVLFQTFLKELRTAGVVIENNGLEEAVVQCILATQKHQVSAENPPTLALFLDLDMAVLGKEAQAYASYAALIRQEYQHVPHEVYCEKRAEILEEFLKQPQIYGSEIMLVALEQRARDNIAREIECLRRGQIPSGNNGNGAQS